MRSEQLDNHFSFFHILLFCIIFPSCQICTNEIQKEEAIDERNKIVLFSRDAGATTSASLQISIMPITKTLGNSKGGNICITNGKHLDYEIKAPYIVIIYTGELFLKKERFNDYIITYIKHE